MTNRNRNRARTLPEADTDEPIELIDPDIVMLSDEPDAPEAPEAPDADEDNEDGLMTPKELAAELGTDPKTFRKFLRGLTNDRAGKGGRWKLDDATVATLRVAWAERGAKGTKPQLKTTADADA